MDRSWRQPIDGAAGAAMGYAAGAAAYLRMSTDMQATSTDNQMEVIAAYAERFGFTIVKVYCDEGKSGLRLSGRDGMQQLLSDASTGTARFSVVLVCDVSRWGRFQDPDEAAEIELRCKRAGIAVHYCAEQFDNDGSLGSSILKTFKRAMAGEYSRELSAKVWQGQANLVRRGFHQGGRPGYGLRRLLIDASGRAKGVLMRGEMKSIASDRVVLIPGPDEEIRIVERIFTMFAKEGRTEREIAHVLNAREIASDTGATWNAGIIERILTNEKYVGNSVWGRTEATLGKPRHARPRCDWVRCDAAFEPIIDRSLFDQARNRMLQRSAGSTDDRMLACLSELLALTGKLTAKAIDEAPGCPTSAAYVYRFGSLRNAYKSIGYETTRDYRFVCERRSADAIEANFKLDLQAQLVGADHIVEPVGKVLLVDRAWTIFPTLSRCQTSHRHAAPQWHVKRMTSARADIQIVARLDRKNEAIMDHFVFPGELFDGCRVVLSEHNGRPIEAYRIEALSDFIHLAKPVHTEDRLWSGHWTK